MSADSPARRNKTADKIDASARRAPMFEAHQQPLPTKPTPLRSLRDPFDDIPEGRPRTARNSTATPRQPKPIERALADRPQRLEQLRPMQPERQTLARQMRDLQHADSMIGQLAGHAPAYQRAARYDTAHESPIDFVRGRPWVLILVAAVSLLVFWFTSSSPKTIISGFTGSAPIAASNAISKVFAQNVPAGQHAVLGEPTVSAQFVNNVLAHYGSPAQGTGQIWIDMGHRYGIDPAYALAFFIHESSAGTNPGWAGNKPGGATTHNIGNIICAGYATCFGRFRDYNSWDAGIEDWYKLISKEYVGDRGAVTVEQIIPIYAPSFENDVNNYVNTVVDLANDWRQGVVR